MLWNLGRVARLRGAVERAKTLLEHSVSLYRQMSNTHRLCQVLWGLGRLAWEQENFIEAARHLEQGLDLARRHGHCYQVADTLGMLALVACEQGAYDRAETLCAEGRANCEGYQYGWGLISSVEARMALRRGEPACAVDLFRKALGHMQRHRARTAIAEMIELLSWALAASGQAGDAAQLLAYATHQRDEMGVVLAPVDGPYHEQTMAAVRTSLGTQAFEAAWAQGAGLDIDEAMDLAMPVG